jgi:hypothetical protein
VAEENQVRRKRRSSRSSSKSTFVGLQSPAIARAIRVGMVLLTLFYVAYTLVLVRQASFLTDGLAIGMTPQDARYLLGPPKRSEQDDTVWYAPTGSTLRIAYDEGTASSIACSDARMEKFGCSGVLGIDIGAVEDQVWWTLGAPTSQSYVGNEKVMRYEDMGLSFTLRRYQVAAIEHFRRSGRFSYVPRAFRVMIPH